MKCRPKDQDFPKTVEKKIPGFRHDEIVRCLSLRCLYYISALMLSKYHRLLQRICVYSRRPHSH